MPGEKYTFYDNLKSFIAQESCAPNKSPPSNTSGESVDNYLFSLIKAHHVKIVFFKEFLYFTNKHSEEPGKNEEAKGRHKNLRPRVLTATSLIMVEKQPQPVGLSVEELVT